MHRADPAQRERFALAVLGVTVASLLILEFGIPSVAGQGWSARSTALSGPSVVRTVTVGGSPNDVVYDPINHDLYLFMENNGTVEVRSAANGALVRTEGPFSGVGPGISACANPSCMAVDPRTGEVFVPNSTRIELLSPNGMGPVRSIADKAVAVSISSDPATNQIYAIDGTGRVSVYNVSTRTLAETLTRPHRGPGGYRSGFGVVAYDSAGQRVDLVSGWYSQSAQSGNAWVSVVDPRMASGLHATHEDLEATGASSGAVDAARKEIFLGVNLAGAGYGAVAAANASTGKGVGEFTPPGYGFGEFVVTLAYDASDALLWALTEQSTGTGNLTAFDPTNGTLATQLALPTEGDALALDPATGDLWVACANGTLAEVHP